MLSRLTNEMRLLLAILKHFPIKCESDFNSSIIKDIEWDVLLKLSQEHQIFPIVYTILSSYIPEKYRAVYDTNFKEHINKGNIYLEELRNIVNASKNIHQFLLIKGFPLSKTIYDAIDMRQIGDLDILVNENEMQYFSTLLTNMGYNQFYMTENNEIEYFPPNTFLYEERFHEYQFMKIVKEKEVYIEIKRATSAIKDTKDIIHFIKNANKVCVGNIEVDTFDDMHTFLHLCTNAYENSEDQYSIISEARFLRDYFDLYVYLSKQRALIDWQNVVRFANKYRILHKIYCVFCNLNHIFEHFVENNFIELFNPKEALYPVYANKGGSIVNWKSTFVDRVFYIEKNKIEFINSFQKICYSSENELYSHPFKAKRGINYKDALSDEKCLVLKNSYKYNILYLPSYENHKICYFILMDQFAFNEFGKFLLIIQFYYRGDRRAVSLTRNIFVMRLNNRIITFFDDESKAAIDPKKESDEINTVYDAGNMKIIKLEIPVNSLEIKLDNKRNKICYNMEIRRNVYNNYYQIIGRQYNDIYGENNKNIREIGVIEYPIE